MGTYAHTIGTPHKIDAYGLTIGTRSRALRVGVTELVGHCGGPFGRYVFCTGANVCMGQGGGYDCACKAKEGPNRVGIWGVVRRSETASLAMPAQSPNIVAVR